jgi:hypothetical protein
LRKALVATAAGDAGPMMTRVFEALLPDRLEGETGDPCRKK